MGGQELFRKLNTKTIFMYINVHFYFIIYKIFNVHIFLHFVVDIIFFFLLTVYSPKIIYVNDIAYCQNIIYIMTIK